MASLRETKDRIASVRGTLKITGAMKLVASAKLRKAQQAVEAMLPYQQELMRTLRLVEAALRPDDWATFRDGVPGDPSALSGVDSEARAAYRDGVSGSDGPVSGSPVSNGAVSGGPFSGGPVSGARVRPCVAVVAVASNSSLCGAFNANIVRSTTQLISALKKEGREVALFTVGRRVTDAFRRQGFELPDDRAALVAHPSYEAAVDLARSLADGYAEGRYERVLLVYNHFVSTSAQQVCTETYLPFALPGAAASCAGSMGSSILSGSAASCSGPIGSSILPGSVPGHSDAVLDPASDGAEAAPEAFLFEPSAAQVRDTLLPQVMRLKIFTVLLDSVAAEHAARTIAMQTATDNAESLLADLTLEYNKGRQQKITSEILDLVGGAQ